MAESLVLISQSSVVKPAKPTQRHTLYLSGADQIFKNVDYHRTILFYKTDTELLPVVESFKRSLSAVLLHFYPLAGRFVKGDDGRLALDCNDAGVEFVEASCDIPFVELEENNFAIRDFFRALTSLGHRTFLEDLEDPLVSVQVTSFVGSGVAVGFTMNHVAADGYSVWHFISSFAQCCRGVPLSVPPLHMRTILRPENFLLNRVAGVEYGIISENSQTKVDERPQNNDSHNGGARFDLMHAPPEQLHQIVLHVSVDMLKRLKSVSAEAGKGSFSSFESLSAYLWRRLTIAQQHSDSVRVGFRIPLDIRSRMIPPLTGAYFGNAAVGVAVSSTAGEMRRESLGEITARIQKAIKSGGDDQYIKDALWTRENLDLMKILYESKVVMSNVRNARGFPVYDTDFGFGKPAAVSPNWNGREGEFTMYPGKAGDGSVVVFIGLTSITLKGFFSPDVEADDPLKEFL